MNEPPSLSVVVATSDSARAAARALASLGGQGCAPRVEIIVAAARHCLGPTGWPLGVRLVIADEGTGVPRLRRLGFDAARAPLVVFTEDSCVFGPGWVASWRRAFEDPRTLAATGPIEPDMGDSPLDWAVFFCEYAPFLPVGNDREIPPTRLAGNNFAVRRAVVEALDPVEIHESEVVGSLADGAIARTTALARHVRRYAASEAIGDRLRFGREYGRLRASGLAWFARPLALLVGPAIFLVQAVRLSRTVAGRREYLGRYLECLPITLALLSAWSIGEWIGWIVAPRRPPAGRQRGTTARPPAPGPGPAGSRRPRCTPAPPVA